MVNNSFENTHQTYNEFLTSTLHAIRPVAAGEEITISYISGLMNSIWSEDANQNGYLERRYDFKCKCSYH